jgi:hypothetical protein
MWLRKDNEIVFILSDDELVGGDKYIWVSKKIEEVGVGLIVRKKVVWSFFRERDKKKHNAMVYVYRSDGYKEYNMYELESAIEIKMRGVMGL